MPQLKNEEIVIFEVFAKNSNMVSVIGVLVSMMHW